MHKLDRDIFYTHQKEETLLMVEGQRDQEEDHLRCGGWTKLVQMKNETSLPEKLNINLTMYIICTRCNQVQTHSFSGLTQTLLSFLTADPSLGWLYYLLHRCIVQVLENEGCIWLPVGGGRLGSNPGGGTEKSMLPITWLLLEVLKKHHVTHLARVDSFFMGHHLYPAWFEILKKSDDLQGFHCQWLHNCGAK